MLTVISVIVMVLLICSGIGLFVISNPKASGKSKLIVGIINTLLMISLAIKDFIIGRYWMVAIVVVIMVLNIIVTSFYYNDYKKENKK